MYQNWLTGNLMMFIQPKQGVLCLASTLEVFNTVHMQCLSVYTLLHSNIVKLAHECCDSMHLVSNA